MMQITAHYEAFQTMIDLAMNHLDQDTCQPMQDWKDQFSRILERTIEECEEFTPGAN